MNLRRGRVIPKSRWQKIRQGLIKEHGLHCQTCGKTETESKRIFAHEEWEYVTTSSPALARLVGLKLSCWHCHAVEHFGATINMVIASGELTERAIQDTIDHFCRLNQVGRDEFNVHFAEAKAEWMRLSKLKWKVDWGTFAPIIADAEQKRRERPNEESDEDTALYEWPYLHTGEPM